MPGAGRNGWCPIFQLNVWRAGDDEQQNDAVTVSSFQLHSLCSVRRTSAVRSPINDARGHGVAGGHARHDGPIGNTKFFYSVDLEIGINHRHGITSHLGGTRLMAVPLQWLGEVESLF
jgi:hypothetical protein